MVGQVGWAVFVPMNKNDLFFLLKYLYIHLLSIDMLVHMHTHT